MENQFQHILINSFQSQEDFNLEVFRIISFEPGFHFKMHSHKRIELNFILKGSCVMMLGDKLVKLSQNNIILIFPGSKHDFYVDSKNGVKIVQLEFLLEESFQKVFEGMLETKLSILYNSKSYIKISNNQEIGNCMERIIKEKKLKRGSFESLSRLYFLELVVLLSRFINKMYETANQQANQHLKKAMNIIHANYSSGVSISSLAKECNISERYLRKLFTVHLESTPQEYCNNLRINKAVELLADHKNPIKEVAYSVGYSTPQYFSRMFKEKYGFSPQVYRKILFESQM